ncbi:MAG: YicC family protein [Verrucomicrobia bacterium]|nr:YicC family protein [Verrucomicrobiota bacterium]
MIHSMTGYGNAKGEVAGRKVSIQLKSLNSKQADISIKLPSLFKEYELDLRKRISDALGRGKIEMYLNIEASEEKASQQINKAVFKNYYTQLKEVLTELNEEEAKIANMVVQFPEVLQTTEDKLDENDRLAIEYVLDEAIFELKTFRKKEGNSLFEDLKQHITTIQSLMTKITFMEKERLPIVRERLLKNLEESGQKEKIDKDRFEQEVIYYTEKYDISEEKVRLKTHCDYFLEILNADPGQGKKLGFVSQEMGREINTLGSKANHSGMQKVVVQMKDELEKIKEQVLNVY